MCANLIYLSILGFQILKVKLKVALAERMEERKILAREIINLSSFSSVSRSSRQWETLQNSTHEAGRKTGDQHGGDQTGQREEHQDRGVQGGEAWRPSVCPPSCCCSEPTLASGTTSERLRYPTFYRQPSSPTVRCPAGADTGVPATPEEAETGLAPGARQDDLRFHFGTLQPRHACYASPQRPQ